MSYYDEKDYIMRMIKEAVRLLTALILGKNANYVELPEENPYEVAGRKVTDLMAMADRGEVNEAENLLLSTIDYGNKEELAAAVAFYQYVGEKSGDFLQQNNYSMEEVLDGLKLLADKAGFGDVEKILEGI